MRDHMMEEGPMPTHWYYYDDVTLITGLARDLQWLPRTRYSVLPTVPASHVMITHSTNYGIM